MPSGASHDAHALARRVPVGMIFVPSRDGISHNGKEWTDAKDVRAAGNLLYEALRILDKEGLSNVLKFLLKVPYNGQYLCYDDARGGRI